MTTMTSNRRMLRGWLGAAATSVALAVVVASCGGSGGGGGNKGRPSDQFFLNSNNQGSLILNVNPVEVDANKSDRIGVVATLTQSNGLPIAGVVITFSSDIEDIRFIGSNLVDPDTGVEIGFATTDANGNADIIAVAGSIPTGTGGIIGTGAIFAQAPIGLRLTGQVQVTLTDVGFIDSDVLTVIPTDLDLVEPALGSVAFINIVGGFPPYILKNEVSGLGAATLSNHCAPGCTENNGSLCIGSPCLDDTDCNENASPTPEDVCIGAIKRCLASCQGTNCGGSRCDTDADCNDGSPTPANVCKDSGQSIVYTFLGDEPGNGTTPSPDGGLSHLFIVEDSQGNSVQVTVTVTFFCGNGVARGDEQCDLAAVSDTVCESFDLAPGCTPGEVGAAFCEVGGITGGESTVTCEGCQLALDCTAPEDPNNP
jgi:hypothetical protein